MKIVTISAMEARRKFGEILNRVYLKNEEIIIQRAGKNIAKLSPVNSKNTSLNKSLDFRNAAGLGQEMWRKIDVNEYLRQERESWE